MIASLPMYDTPATREANNRFWQAICSQLENPPLALERDADPHGYWLSEDLLFSQTCGMPYRTTLHGHAQLVATPDYAVEGCPPGYYRSCLVIRADDTRNTLEDFVAERLARNDARSQSGWAAFISHFEPIGGFSGSVIDTGAHAASAAAVAAEQADIAAIDAVTWALLCRDTPEDVHNLRVLDQTIPTPGLPFITGPAQDPEVLRGAVRKALDALSHADRDCLLLKGIVVIPAEEYLAIASP